MEQPAPRNNTGSVLQALLSALGLAACGVGAAAMLLAGLLLSNSGRYLMREQSTVFLALAWIFTLLAVVALLSLIFASRRIAGRPAPPPSRSSGLRSASLAMLLWPPVLAVGSLVSNQAELARYLLPPLQIAAVVLPLWWLVELALNKLPAPSPQRAWGVLNFSIFFSTPLVILAEVIFLLAVGVIVVLAANGQPGLKSQLEELSQRILNAAGNPQALIRIYQPLVAQPWFIFSILVGLSGLVPLIEELLKPLAVWTLVGRQLTSAEGFAAGALAGAGFALIETLFSLAGPAGSGWLQLTVARAGTGLLHIGTAALMGRALAQAWHSSHYLRAGLTFFSVAAVHGLWNAFSVLSGYADLLAGKTGLLNLLYRLGTIAPYMLGLIAVGMFLAILSTNLRLRASPSTSNPAGSAATS